MKIKLFLVLCFCAFFSQASHAIKVAGLYQSTVPVTNESAVVRQAAIKQALINVLIKLTGDKNIQQSQNISGILLNPDRYVQQFRYSQKLDEVSDQEIKQIWVQFDESALNESIRNYGLTIWGNVRPSILVWIASDELGKRSLISFEQKPEYINILEQSASNRGLSLLFPLLDLQDTAKMKVSDIWAGFKEPILGASDRYQPDIVLTIKLSKQSTNIWEADWVSYIDDQTQSWNTQGDIVNIVLEEGIDLLTDKLAQQYTNTATTRTELIEVKVVGINNIDNYAKALTYLESLQSITEVSVKRVTENDVVYELMTHGGQSVIDQAIDLGKTLEKTTATDKPTYRLLSR